MIQYNTHLCYANMALCDKNQVKLKTITVQSHPPKNLLNPQYFIILQHVMCAQRYARLVRLVIFPMSGNDTFETSDIADPPFSFEAA